MGSVFKAKNHLFNFSRAAKPLAGRDITSRLSFKVAKILVPGLFFPLTVYSLLPSGIKSHPSLRREGWGAAARPPRVREVANPLATCANPRASRRCTKPSLAWKAVEFPPHPQKKHHHGTSAPSWCWLSAPSGWVHWLCWGKWPKSPGVLL